MEEYQMCSDTIYEIQDKDFFSGFFVEYMPHGQCWDYDPFLILLNSIGDVGTFICYVLIPILLYRVFYLFKGHVKFVWQLIVLGGGFIFFCGSGHFIAWVNIYFNYYYFEAVWKILTFLISALFIGWFSLYLKKMLKMVFSKIADLEKLNLEKTSKIDLLKEDVKRFQEERQSLMSKINEHGRNLG